MYLIILAAFRTFKEYYKSRPLLYFSMLAHLSIGVIFLRCTLITVHTNNGEERFY